MGRWMEERRERERGWVVVVVQKLIGGGQRTGRKIPGVSLLAHSGASVDPCVPRPPHVSQSAVSRFYQSPVQNHNSVPLFTAGHSKPMRQAGGNTRSHSTDLSGHIAFELPR